MPATIADASAVVGTSVCGERNHVERFFNKLKQFGALPPATKSSGQRH
jgi:transposase